MEASRAAALICFLLMIGSTFLSEQADSSTERRLWYGLAFASLIGAIASNNLKGWIGPSYREMKEEMARLEKLMEKWEFSDGSLIPDKERKRIQHRYQRLLESIQFHPDNPQR